MSDSKEIKYTEVCIVDPVGDEHIYWVKMDVMPKDEDEIDWSIEQATNHHVDTLGLEIMRDDEEFLSITAYEPFDRGVDEYIVI